MRAVTDDTVEVRVISVVVATTDAVLLAKAIDRLGLIVSRRGIVEAVRVGVRVEIGTNLNSTLVRAATVNGTDQIFLNGTLPNGTTASGGSDSAATGITGRAFESMGWCVVGSAIAVAMWMM